MPSATSRPNLFADLGPAPDERFDTLAVSAGLRIERIVSWGQASAPGYWYDQDEDEWVCLLAGRARLRMQGPDEEVELAPGDWLWFAAHRRHRVEWTAPDRATVWLAVFGRVDAADGPGHPPD
jgi:cupin 2 domain-containing protein